jgi:hypothetical protein
LPYERYGWQSNLDIFSNSEPRVVRGRLTDFLPNSKPEQVRAWDQSIPWLQSECRVLTAREPRAGEYTAILEYELPRDFRRPDVIVLERGCVAVLELKGYPNASQAAIDQALGYARDLAAYHAACANCPVIPVLLVRADTSDAIQQDGVYITGPKGLSGLLQKFGNRDGSSISVDAFLSADAYAPLPTIVKAARELFNKRPLPTIKRARAATEPALQYITKVAHDAARTKTRHLVLLTGVPGSGKTLVGLQLVHAGWIDDLAVDRGAGKPTAPAVYLSGNGPLVDVLQHALKEAGGGGKTFVQAIKNYVATYSRPRASAPPEHLIVFDEAQRAHDAERVAQVHNHAVGLSEPEHLIEFCSKIPEWCVLVALIGDGQAIHTGEEGGPALWAKAISRMRDRQQWNVHGAPHFKEIFQGVSDSPSWDKVLNLDTEIRYHLTPKVHDFVGGLLNQGPIEQIRAIASDLDSSGHRYLVTRDLNMACEYLRERYAGATEARFGMLASSKDKWLVSFGVDNSFQTTKRLRVGPWYNAAPSDPESCCQLCTVATEFSAQGLELDCALVSWGSDLLIKDGRWSIEHSRGSRGEIRDPEALRKNVYRVLLTRGRDGTIVYVPSDIRFDSTYSHLVHAGMRELTNSAPLPV